MTLIWRPARSEAVTELVARMTIEMSKQMKVIILTARETTGETAAVDDGIEETAAAADGGGSIYHIFIIILIRPYFLLQLTIYLCF